MHLDPVVKVPEDPQRILQQIAPMRHLSRPAGQTALTAANRTVESLQVRGVDQVPDVQGPDPGFDLPDGPEQSLAPDFLQVALAVADLLDDPHPQPRGRLEAGRRLRPRRCRRRRCLIRPKTCSKAEGYGRWSSIRNNGSRPGKPLPPRPPTPPPPPECEERHASRGQSGF